jgi:hypothetical protein
MTEQEVMNYFRPSTLDSRLQDYYSEQNGIPMIKHPLCFSIFHTPQQNYRMNKYLEYKLQATEEALNKKEYATYIFLHERPYRLEAFLEVERKLDDEQYWELLGDIWTDSENIWQNKIIWGALLTSDRPKREFFMNEDERAEFEKLPENLTIYRGYQPRKNKVGYSYTISKDKATWFAHRFHKDGEVDTKKVNKGRVFAYLSRRNESEVLIIS